MTMKRFRATGLALLFLGMAFFLHACRCHKKSASKNKLDQSKTIRYDAIIVPGYPFDGEEWSMLLKDRIQWSAHLYNSKIAQNIIYSGSSVYTPYVESKIMALYAQALGVPKEHILTETQAEHSSENLYYSYQLAQENGFKRIAIATDPFQARFLKRFVKKMKGVQIDFLPIQYDVIRNKDLNTPTIDAQQAFVQDFESLPDRESFFERMKGTMGKKVDWDILKESSSQ